MEYPTISPNGPPPNTLAPNNRFIEANTIPIGLEEIRQKHLIPVFVKDNSPTISQADFIAATIETVEEVSQKSASLPSIRVSHPIKGRVFEARNKSADELEEWEKTIYYERLAFVAELPAVSETIDGKELKLCFGGIKAYNQDNLYSKNSSIQKFRFFMGFQVKVCTNLCIWTDGYSSELRVSSLAELQQQIYEVIQRFQISEQIAALEKLLNYEISENQFAQFIGKARMYQYLPKDVKTTIPEMLISDTQVSTVAREYFLDTWFGGKENGSMDLWRVYNLLTHAVKSSYIDAFLDRNINAYQLVNGISQGLEGKGDYRWFLN